MRHLLTDSLILMAAIALLAVGCNNQARAPKGWTPTDTDPAGYREPVAEVVVTAERPAGVMPEVVVRANLMTEVVAQASTAPVILSVLPSALPVN